MALSTIKTASIANDAVTTDKIVNDGNLGNRNILINGAMAVDQRHDGSSFTIVNGNSTTGVIADRFRVNETSGVVMTGQRVADAPVGFEYSSKLTVTTADSSLGSTEFHRMIQPIEGKNISNLNWGTSNAKTLTLTFYVKSSLTGQYYISVFNNAADRTLLKGYTISSANTWEKKTITVIGDQTGTWLTTNAAGIYLMWSLGTGSSYQSNTLDAYQAGFFMAKSDQVNLAATNGSTWQLTGVQLEVGDTATPFEHEDFATTLRKCQRYFSKSAIYSVAPADGQDSKSVTTSIDMASGLLRTTAITFPVYMRATPTVTPLKESGAGGGSSGQWAYYQAGTWTYNSFSAGTINEQNYTGHTSGGAGDGQAYYTHINWKADAEL